MPPAASSSPDWSHELEIRVTYQETDGQRRVHHSNYLNYFERGRIEMLRERGIRYRDLEDRGLLLVVTEATLRFISAAEFDDVLTVRTEVAEVRKVRIRHRYRVLRGATLLAEGETVIACVDRDGNPSRLPAELFSAM